MKTAIIYAPDWPGDEVVMTFGADEWAAVRQHFDACPHGLVGETAVVLADRIGFRTLHRYVDGLRTRPEAPGYIRELGSQLDRVGEALTRAREGDRSGDPAPGAAHADQLAEA